MVWVLIRMECEALFNLQSYIMAVEDLSMPRAMITIFTAKVTLSYNGSS